jgi:TolA-binding protein
MSVVELQHPEDLLDKLELGSLSAAERARLDAHLDGCATCRMELAMRSDFAAEPPLALPELPQLTLLRHEPEPRPSGIVPRPSRKRRFSLLAVAAAWCASSALAATAAISTVKGPLAAWFGVKEAPAVTHNNPVVSHKPHAKSSLAARTAVPAPELSPSAAEATSAAPEASSSATPEASSTNDRATPPSGALMPAHTSKAEPAPENDDSTAPAPSAASSNTATFPPLAGEATNPDAASMLAEADRARRAGDASRALTLYRELEQSYPSSPESQLSFALLAKLFLDRGDAARALAAYETYLRDGSASLRAEALVGRARALEELGRTNDAIEAWQEVEQRLPGSIHAELAAARLVALSNR